MVRFKPFKYLLHRSYREWWKWRRKNLHNNTELVHYYNHPYVHVGKKTYGMIDVRTYGKKIEIYILVITVLLLMMLHFIYRLIII